MHNNKKNETFLFGCVVNKYLNYLKIKLKFFIKFEFDLKGGEKTWINSLKNFIYFPQNFKTSEKILNKIPIPKNV